MGATSLVKIVGGRLLERVTLWARRGYGFCLVCGRWTFFRISSANVREDCVCSHCGSINRQRQIASILLRGQTGAERVNSVAAFRPPAGFRIYNTEASGSLHAHLKLLPGYLASDYFGPEFSSGDLHVGVLHQDLQQLSFADASFDLVLSSEVFEHIPDPYLAHREVLRVLRPGGRHVFTVPFDGASANDDVRARLDGDGAIHHLKPPEYHGDPVRPEAGILVYTIFGTEMLGNLERLGFDARRHDINKPWFGIVGPSMMVFEAIKPG